MVTTATLPLEKTGYFDLLNETLHFTDRERALLEKNGFMVSDRLAFPQFKRAYAYIYWKDLPVLVTTDSILHAIHQTYDRLLASIEQSLLIPWLTEFLTKTREQVREAQKVNQDERLASYYHDLDMYLTISLELLTHEKKGLVSSELYPYLAPIQATTGDIAFLEGTSREEIINQTEKNQLPVVGIQDVRLFGYSRKIDFTQFTPRGHYDWPRALSHYFKAMMWLQLLDFRFAESDPSGELHLHIGQLVAAHMLRDAIDQAGQRNTWNRINQILMAFVGWSDNITLNGLDSFIAAAGAKSPADYFDIDKTDLLNLLTWNDYGHQRLRGQIQAKAPDNDEVLPHNVVFVLMGQRFTIESYIMEQVVFDKLRVNGESVPRAYPSPLDVMAALGNDHAETHLKAEFKTYGYQSRLKELREQVESFSYEWWESSFYNLWLNIIRSLNIKTTDERYPKAMRSDAYADKTLHTQLASWAQLRHDNILLVKQPEGMAAVCEYPAGYVEPYPEFYVAVGNYARYGRQLFEQMDIGEKPDMSASEIRQKAETIDAWHEKEKFLAPYQTFRTHDTVLHYFSHLEDTAARLEKLVRKELAGEPFTEEDNLFLRSIVVRKYVGDSGYGGFTEEHWDGWYNRLLPFDDDSPELVADIYANVNEDIGEPGVLHIGTGKPVPEVFILDTPDGQSMYIGPVFTYAEYLHTGYPLHRLTDGEWRHSEPRAEATALKGYRDLLRNFTQQLEDIEPDSQKARELEWQIQNFQTKIKVLEGRMTQPKSPEWASSFRLSGDESIKLELPRNALESVGLDRKTIRKMWLAGINCISHWGIADLQKLLEENPDKLLEVEGFDNARIEKLIRDMKDKGYWQTSRSD